jgi:hypothetical protein
MTQESYQEFRRVQELAKKSMEQDDAECLKLLDGEGDDGGMRAVHAATAAAIATGDQTNKAPRLPAYITFGKYLIKTWFSAPYPHEYVQKKVLHICEFCLKYMKTKKVLELHMKRKVHLLIYILKMKSITVTNFSLCLKIPTFEKTVI